MRCAIERCGTPEVSRTLCRRHYKLWILSLECKREVAWMQAEGEQDALHARAFQAWKDFVMRISAEERHAGRP